jgi:hypothetical protein
LAEGFKIVGRGLFVATVALAVYEVLHAENKATESARQAAILAGGAVGGYAGSWMVSAMAGGKIGLGCGRYALICSGAGLVIGGALGALGAEYLVDEMLTEE